MIRQLYSPAFTIPGRLRAVKRIIVIGLLLSIGASWKLWITDRLFPQIPLFNVGFTPGVVAGYITIILFFISLLGVFFSRWSRPWILASLLLAIVLVVFDQNRLQPWFYMYMLLLGVLSFYNWRVDEPRKYTQIYTSITIVIGAIYFWSGVQKLNHEFTTTTWTWFIEPLDKVLSSEELRIVDKLGVFVPYLEMLIGVGLFFPEIKKAIIPLALLMHLTIIILLSPVFHDYNKVVWGWNVAMMLLVYFLFAGSVESRYRQFTYLVEFKPVFFVIALSVCLPALNLFNKWDSYLSANLYSGNTANGQILITGKAMEKLPYYIKLFTKSEGGDYYTIEVKKWAMAEMGVPGYPEPRIFNALHRYIQTITCCENEVTLFINEKRAVFADA